MGRRSGGTQSPVDQYRKQLGKHERHIGTSKSRGLSGRRKSPNHTTSGSSMKQKYILQLGAVLVLLLVGIGLIYFIGFMGVVQVLYDLVEWVNSYWQTRLQSEESGSR